MPLSKLLPSNRVATADPIRDLALQLSSISETRSLSDSKIGSIAIATESMDNESSTMLQTVASNMKSTIESITEAFGSSMSFESHQVEAATLGGMISTNPREMLKVKLKPIDPSAMALTANVSDGHLDRGISLEAYDERENRQAQMFTILYNLLASRQDEFGETFFPTIVINPTEVGVLISVKLFYVYNDFKRSVTGSLANYGRMNVIRAYANADVLKNELTRAIPVLRTGGGVDDNSAMFVPVSKVPARTVDLGVGISVTTGALKVDQRVDLIGMSQTNELLNSGLMGPTDNLDAFVKLDKVYLEVADGQTSDVVTIDTYNLQGSTMTYAPQGNSRRMILDMDTDSVVLGNDTTKADGNALEVLTELAGYSARLQLTISGSVSLDKGDTIINRGSVKLVTLRDLAGNLVTGAPFDALAAKIDGGEIIGAELVAFRAGSNIRQRGQLLDTQSEFRVIQVPYRSPISVLAPTMSVHGEDTSALQSLITTTGIRISNEAVTALLRAQSALSSYKHVANANGDLPEMSDIGFYYVKPVYFQEEVKLENSVDSLKSHERIRDIRAALVEKIRFYATEMYRSSEYKAAADVLTGNIGYKPTVIVGTDPVIYNYIQADGDLRTLGDKFDVKVVCTLDSRMKGKVVISFGVFDGTRNTALNPLNSGNMLYASELVTNMPISRDGQTSQELIVTPRFYHVWNLPVMTFLTVSGLSEVTSKVAVHTVEQ